uniref:Phospholipid scramblase n=1 Tax=Globodera pallida TaxID=36090 RepID=A0A183CJN9_GLOPA
MISCRAVSRGLLFQVAPRFAPQPSFGPVQPCSSSQNGPMAVLHPSKCNCAISLLPTLSRTLSSSVGDKSHERPQMFQLEHIQKRLEFTVPLMFDTRLDYTFYRKDVVVEDQIAGSVINGLEALQQHMAFVNIFCRIRYSHIEAQILNVLPILEDGTVRLRWRVLYLGWLGMLNLRNFNYEYRKKNLRWFDGYSIFYVDGEGLVYKATIQKTMPDESLKLSSMKDKTKEFVQRVGIQA